MGAVVCVCTCVWTVSVRVTVRVWLEWRGGCGWHGILTQRLCWVLPTTTTHTTATDVDSLYVRTRLPAACAGQPSCVWLAYCGGLEPAARVRGCGRVVAVGALVCICTVSMCMWLEWRGGCGWHGMLTSRFCWVLPTTPTCSTTTTDSHSEYVRKRLPAACAAQPYVWLACYGMLWVAAGVRVWGWWLGAVVCICTVSVRIWLEWRGGCGWHGILT